MFSLLHNLLIEHDDQPPHTRANAVDRQIMVINQSINRKTTSTYAPIYYWPTMAEKDSSGRTVFHTTSVVAN